MTYDEKPVWPEHFGAIQREGAFLYQLNASTDAGMNVWSCSVQPNNGYGQEHAFKVATLMAAAGDLLDALEIATDTLATFVECGSAAPDSVIGKNVTRARAAIAKARGET